VKLILLIVGILCVHVAFAQEHAPTATQCQADQRLWLSQLETPTGPADVQYSTLVKWVDELQKCTVVDPDRASEYENTRNETLFVEATRQSSFIQRHGLFPQFLAEDKAGKR
jgi:hypothetical protein